MAKFLSSDIFSLGRFLTHRSAAGFYVSENESGVNTDSRPIILPTRIRNDNGRIRKTAASVSSRHFLLHAVVFHAGELDISLVATLPYTELQETLTVLSPKHKLLLLTSIILDSTNTKTKHFVPKLPRHQHVPPLLTSQRPHLNTPMSPGQALPAARQHSKLARN